MIGGRSCVASIIAIQRPDIFRHLTFLVEAFL